MILSKAHNFIFLKTTKTAGTSFEIALSKYAGPEDVVTPISDEDELTRSRLGYRGPQNFLEPPGFLERVGLRGARLPRRDLDVVRLHLPRPHSLSPLLSWPLLVAPPCLTPCGSDFMRLFSRQTNEPATECFHNLCMC